MRFVSLPVRIIAVALLVAGLLAPSAAVAAPDPSGAVPSPSRQPASHRTQAGGAPITRLSIPSIGVEETVRSGVAMAVIDRGVAHWVGTAMPGSVGNVVLAGHRTTHTAPFNRIDELEPGDLIVLERDSGVDAIYRVTDTFVVRPEEVWITYDVPGTATVTLFACHPKGSAEYRLVVRGTLVGGGWIA